MTFVNVLVVCAPCDLLHQCGGGTPWISVGGFSHLAQSAHRCLFRAVLQPYLRLHLSEVHDRYSSSASTSGQVKANCTILNFPHTGLDIVKRQVADLVPDAVEVHVSDLLVGSD